MPAMGLTSTEVLLARLENELRNRRLRLKFRQPDLEAGYRRHHMATHYLWARITAAVGVAMFAVLGFKDGQVLPPAVAEVVLTISLLVIAPFIIVVGVLSFLPRVQQWGFSYLFGCALVVAVFTGTVIGYPAQHAVPTLFEQIMILQIAVSVLMGLLFWQVVTVNVTVIAVYTLMIATAPEKVAYLYWSLVELVASGTLCSMGAWFLERRGRQEYLARQMLELTANIDGLTLLANRRKFMKHLELVWRQACREGKSLCAMMVDLDHFKEYNDYYGHIAGDECLQRVADVLGTCARRPLDLVCRFGGEEFVLIFYDAEEQAIAEVGERVRRQLEQLALPHTGSPTADHVTASIGVVHCLPDTGLDSDALMRAADDALYQAKREGRNRVHVGAALAARRDPATSASA